MPAAPAAPKNARPGWRARVQDFLSGPPAPDTPAVVVRVETHEIAVAFPTESLVAEGNGWRFEVAGDEAWRVRAEAGPVLSGRVRLDLTSAGDLPFGCQLVAAAGAAIATMRLSEPLAQGFLDVGAEGAPLKLTLRLVGRGRLTGSMTLAVAAVERDPAEQLAEVEVLLARGEATAALSAMTDAIRSGVRSTEAARRLEAAARATGPGEVVLAAWDALIGESAAPLGWRARRDQARVELDEAGPATGAPALPSPAVRDALAHLALGLGVRARIELERLTASPGDRAGALWALAGIDRVEGRGDDALRRLAMLQAEGGWAPGLAAMKAQLSGSIAPLADAPACDGDDLARASLSDGPDRLAALNAVFARHGLATVAGDASMDSLVTRATARSVAGPRVTVIMPIFNAEATLETSLRSIATQTWADLEVLVVDDCSTDGTLALAQAFAKRDRRFRVMSNDRNRGPYHSRNRGLAAAKGVYVTCQDADDWSHPERVERQVRALEANPDWIADLSRCATCTPDLVFVSRSRVASPLRWNLSSLMLRRKAALAGAGFWDEVRFGADNEYLARLRAVFGADAVGHLTDGPLALVRQSPDSLTASAGGGLDGVGHTMRIDYRQRYLAAHKDNLSPRRREGPRPFAVPPHLAERVAPRETFDRLLAGDLREPDTVARAAALADSATGLMHTPLWSAAPGRPLDAAVRALDADLITAERSASAPVLTLLDAAAFETPLEGLPTLAVERVEAVETPSVDRAAVEAVVRDLYGLPVVWVSAPVSRG